MKKLLTFPGRLTFCFVLLGFASFLHANDTDPSPETIRLLASQCAQCHGTNGNSLGGFDSIAGESFRELLDELLEMKVDNDNEVMHKQIKGYTDQQIWFIAEYYSSLPRSSQNDGSGEEVKRKKRRERD